MTEWTLHEFQQRTGQWCVDCFGETTAADVQERTYRFIEEALELGQACGMTADQARDLVAYVFARPAGDVPQEIGGTMVTLAALCAGRGVDLDASAWGELARVLRPETMERVRAKHANKPHRSPLPGDYKYAAPANLTDDRVDDDEAEFDAM